MAKILIVEDEQHLAGPVADWLKRENHVTEIIGNGLDANEMLRMHEYDLVILDWMLPGMSGMEICKQHRESGGTTPILMLTARSSVDDRAEGLDSGADDYLTKPFHLKELSARVRALLRRPKQTANNILQTGALTLNPATAEVTVHDKPLHLLPKEFSLLELFMRYPNQVFSAEAIIERVWQSDTGAMSDTVRTHIKTLRKKLDQAGMPACIATVHGVGYKLETDHL